LTRRFFIAAVLLIAGASAATQQQQASYQSYHNEINKDRRQSGYNSGLTLECDFGMIRHYWGEMYTCIVRNLVTRNYYEYVVNATGDHMNGKTDKDVQCVYVLGQRTPFIPYNITSPFGRVTALRVEGSGVRHVNRTWSYEGPLEYLHFENNYITDVPAWAFRNMTELKWFSLRGNRIRYLESGLLTGMKNLWRFSVSRNQIEVIPSGLFRDTTGLKEIYFYNNRIRMVGPKLVKFIQGLKIAAFMGNPCTEISIYDGVDVGNRLTTEFTTKCAVDCRHAQIAVEKDNKELELVYQGFKKCSESYPTGYSQDYHQYIPRNYNRMNYQSQYN
jgi:Leucine-rich repeat (LRR) protein